MTTTSESEVLGGLRAALDGKVIGPDDPEYDGARRVFVPDVDRRPVAIARPGDADGVAAVIETARASGLDLAIRGGGHSGAGYGVCDGGIVLDLSGINDVEVDAERRTAWAGGGLTAGEYTHTVAEHGVATGFGDTASVGIGGLTLGGGVGFLSRKYGLTVDNLLAAEVVTADGEQLLVDAEHHPDLFWAIRGGGGNFGVVTRFKFRLHEVPSATTGMLMLPATPEVLSGFLTEAEAAPDELSTIVNVMPAPPMPFVPAEHHGALVLMALVCYAGPPDEGARVLERFRGLAPALADMVKPGRYADLFPPDESDYRPTAVARTGFAGQVDLDTAAAVIERVRTSTAPMRAVQLRVLGGAISRVEPGATAYAHRSARIMTNVAAFYDAPAEIAERAAWVENTIGLLSGQDAGAYVNFLADEGSSRVRAAYPGPTWDRLVATKRRYDPSNLFRLNQNVPAHGT